MENFVLNIIDNCFQVFYWVIIADCVMSWIPALRESSIGKLLYSVTEPILLPIRKMMDNSPIGGGMFIDFSPVIALFFMSIACNILKSLARLVL